MQPAYFKMKRQKLSDREVYPALLITAASLLVAYLVWRFLLRQPSLPGCFFYARWHVYCPACGGTRAAEALLRGHLGASLYYNPAVPFTAVSAAAYLLSQSVWRLRKKRGIVLHYSAGWLKICVLLLLLHCVVQNFLWFGLHRPL